jgi:hypothetical protein
MAGSPVALVAGIFAQAFWALLSGNSVFVGKVLEDQQQADCSGEYIPVSPLKG